MNRCRSAAVIVMVLTLAPWVRAQAQTAQPSTIHQAKEATTAATIPPEDQATKEQVERLFEVTRVRQQTEQMVQQMSSMMRQQIADSMKKDAAEMPDEKKLSPEQLEARRQIVAKVLDRALHMYTVDEILADVLPIYQRHISKEDVEAFIAFFGSSSGQHFLDEQPLIVKDYMPLVMSRVQEKSETLREEVKKDMEELNKSTSEAGDGGTKN